MKKRKKATKKSVRPSVYNLTLTMGKEVFSSQGKTLDEAIKSLKLKKFTAKGVFTFSKDGKTSKPTYLFIPRMKQLFGDGLSSQVQRTVLIKRLLLML